MSYLSEAISFLAANKGRPVLQTELLKYVASARGTSTERVRGTIIKFNGGLLNPKMLRSLGLRRDRSPARFVAGECVTEDYQSYHCPIKRAVVSKVLDHISGTTPTFVTLAGEHGLDVEQFLSLYPNGTAINFERDSTIAARFSSKFTNVETHIDSFKSAAGIACDLAFYDSVGYACQSTEDTVLAFNRSQNPAVIAITLIDINGIRNHGEWAELARAMFTGEDPTKEWLESAMSNYKLVEEIKYKKTNMPGARGMRVFVFKRKENSV